MSEETQGLTDPNAQLGTPPAESQEGQGQDVTGVEAEQSVDLQAQSGEPGAEEPVIEQEDPEEVKGLQGGLHNALRDEAGATAAAPEVDEVKGFQDDQAAGPAPECR